jgi:hypothetical protein
MGPNDRSQLITGITASIQERVYDASVMFFISTRHELSEDVLLSPEVRVQRRGR